MTNKEELREKIRLVITHPTGNQCSQNMIDDIMHLIDEQTMDARLDEYLSAGEAFMNDDTAYFGRLIEMGLVQSEDNNE